MTTQPSIESLRETLYEIIPPSDPESEHPGRFSDLLAALDELERLRQMPTLEAAAIARAEKAEAARDQWRRYAEDQRQGWSAAMVSVQTAQTILELLVDGEEVKEEARRWLRGSAHTDLEANDARVRREALEAGWARMGNAPDPLQPGYYVCNYIEASRWAALEEALFIGTENTAPREEETK